ncbi:MAG TPA: peptidylprolyl isomerase, partial [Burkholderiaceae bacterium]|nr:peptidylprolyl isomerase [Burkholderiaceae bacterium]
RKCVRADSPLNMNEPTTLTSTLPPSRRGFAARADARSIFLARLLRGAFRTALPGPGWSARCLALLALAVALPACAQFAASAPGAGANARGPIPATISPITRRPGVLPGDFIVAVVNQESVTANELAERIHRLQDEQATNGGAPPTAAEYRKMALDQLVEERVVVTYARDNGVKVDDAELDRAVSNIAESNKLSIDQMREKLRQQGTDWTAFRNGIKDQIMIERVRTREVASHVHISDVEVDDYIAKERAAKGKAEQVDLAQILVDVPENAAESVVAERQARVDEALARVRNGEPFEQVAKALSDDANKDKGGEMGARPLDRYPDLFVAAVRDLPVGAVTPVLRSPAGFHIVKVLSRGADAGINIVQTRVRHIVLRPSEQVTLQQVEQRATEMRQAIVDGRAQFDDLARKYSEDGSAAQGGDLGWTNPGSFVPEFEEAMNKLPTGAISQPVQTRFGVHLIQVLDRRETTLDPKQLREQATNALKEQKFDTAYKEWVADLRSKSFIEYRDQ